MSQTPLSYKDAGVDIVAGDELVERIKPLAKKTMREGVLAGIGGFGALFEVPKRYKEPVLVSGIANGCELSGCALSGGETAERPGVAPAGEYDLAGVAVGAVEKAKIRT